MDQILPFTSEHSRKKVSEAVYRSRLRSGCETQLLELAKLIRNLFAASKIISDPLQEYHHIRTKTIVSGRMRMGCQPRIDLPN
jgi:hypothetical protein